MSLAALCGGLFGQNAPDVVWKKSLVFEPIASVGGPLPVNTMNLAAHQGRLYAGMAAAFERGGYSGHSASVYMKENAKAGWRLDADFGPGTERVGAMLSVRLRHGPNGKPIPGGPVEALVAGVIKLRRAGEPSPLRVWVKNDQTGKWQVSVVSKMHVTGYNVRDLIVHRDQVTGADVVILGASPAPLGLFRAAYDPDAPGQLRWSDAPEPVEGQSEVGKWFGMAEVNGVLLASNDRAIYRRVDGRAARWVRVAEFPPAGESGNPEVRGLTAVPNPSERTSWPEREMLFFSTQGKLWRMRVPPAIETEHARQEELDMRSFLSRELGRPVLYAEAAFNRLRSFPQLGRAELFRPVGVQFVYGEGSLREQRRKLRGRGLDPASATFPKQAYYMLRNQRGEYTLRSIFDPTEPDRLLFLARDFEVSPFPGEENVIYAGGFNGSFFKGSLGTAWVYRGELLESAAPAH
jgi:hypothetical protein